MLNLLLKCRAAIVRRTGVPTDLVFSIFNFRNGATVRVQFMRFSVSNFPQQFEASRRSTQFGFRRNPRSAISDMFLRLRQIR